MTTLKRSILKAFEQKLTKAIVEKKKKDLNVNLTIISYVSTNYLIRQSRLK